MPDIIKWLAGIGVTVLGWLYRGHENRLQSLELTREVKADADKQRETLRHELHEFRDETREQFESLRSEANSKRDETRHELGNFRAESGLRLETMRVETNAKLDKLTDQITDLAMTRKRVK